MNLHRYRHVVAPIAAIVLLVTACGGGGEETTETTEAASPIAEFLGEDSFGFGGEISDEQKAQYVEQERQREEKVALCMSEQGFDYTPRDTSQDFNFFEGGEDGLEWGTREWSEKWGLGISTQRYSQEAVGPDLVGHDFDSAPAEGEDEPQDPNQEYYESLDDSTRKAYDDALHGAEDFPMIDESTMSEEEVEAAYDAFEPTGCYATANEDSQYEKLEEFNTEFGDEMNKMWETALKDPRVTEAYAKINECMTEKGLEPISLDIDEDPYQKFEEKLEEVDKLAGPSPIDEMTEEDFAEMSEEELERLFSQSQVLSDEAKVKLGEIQKEEIEFALGSFDCGGSFFEVPDILKEVVVEYEEQFLTDNASELEKFRGSAKS